MFSLLRFVQVWSSYSVLNVLYSLIQKSKINEYIIASQEGKSVAEIKLAESLLSNITTENF